MKSKFLRIFIILVVSITAYGQEQEPKAVFPDGTTVLFESKIGSTSIEKSGLKVTAITIISPLSRFTGKNSVNRIFIDRGNKIHFGYELEISKETEKGKYKITFKPLSMPLFSGDSEEKNLTKFPEPLQISEADQISVDLLENPKTKDKITDFIKIVQGKPSQQNSLASPIIITGGPDVKTTQTIASSTRISIPDLDLTSEPKDFSLEDVKMQFVGANILLNGQIKLEKKSALGGNIYFYLKDKGRFILSPVPREGYKFQKKGLISNNKITFEINGDKIEINAVAPIMYYGGKWNLWVLYEPDYRPISDKESEFGGGNIDSLFRVKDKNQNQKN